MNPIFLGVDVAGAKNTWVAALSPKGGSLEVVAIPHLSTLEKIAAYCEEKSVVAVAIDAQLTMALSDEDGFRTSDRWLRALLPPDCQNWVASINSLMAVPIRGRLLADSLSPVVGTLLETHPRASLLFGLEKTAGTAIRNYKRKDSSAKEHTIALLRRWCSRFHIAVGSEIPTKDGALDSLVCATVAYLFHHAPERLLKLRYKVEGKTGRGPFYVLAPIPESEAHDANNSPQS